MREMKEAPVSTTDRQFLDLELSEEKSYWVRQLSGELSVAGIPLDFRRPATFARRDARVDFQLAPELSDKVRHLCGDNESLVFTVLATALETCLHKYTGLEDIVIGTTIHQKHAGVAALNKVLALRTHVDATMSVRRLLEDVRQTAADAYTHQKYPFDRILEALSIEAPANRAPFFSLVLIYEGINNAANVAHLMNDTTLVIDTTGLDERPWLDTVGHPRSSMARIQERYRRLDQYNIQVTVTVDDPKFYTKPWTFMRANLYWMKAQEFPETLCIPSEAIEYRDTLTKPSGIQVVP